MVHAVISVVIQTVGEGLVARAAQLGDIVCSRSWGGRAKVRQGLRPEASNKGQEATGRRRRPAHRRHGFGDNMGKGDILGNHSLLFAGNGPDFKHFVVTSNGTKLRCFGIFPTIDDHQPIWNRSEGAGPAGIVHESG